MSPKPSAQKGIGYEIRAELSRLGISGWQYELAISLADAMDEEPTASVANQLRVLMNDISDGAAPQAATPADELRKKREARRADERRRASSS